jgi:hypothetical protein
VQGEILSFFYPRKHQTWVFLHAGSSSILKTLHRPHKTGIYSGVCDQTWHNDCLHHISGFRFFRKAQNSKQHILHLWINDTTIKILTNFGRYAEQLFIFRDFLKFSRLWKCHFDRVWRFSCKHLDQCANWKVCQIESNIPWKVRWFSQFINWIAPDCRMNFSDRFSDFYFPWLPFWIFHNTI